MFPQILEFIAIKIFIYIR